MERNILREEKGVALIIALLMLLVLTLIGISSISTTTFETSISGNERVRADAFYAAEAGIQVAINQLPFDTNPIPKTKLKEDTYYWSGAPQYKGEWWKPGFEVSAPTAYDGPPVRFSRYQANATGESFGSTKEIEVQVRYGPF